VNWVSWHEAMAFCAKLDDLERQAARVPPGYRYRLPTEAEWEYACRAGSQGDRGQGVEKFWSAETAGGRLHEVGELPPNQWGLYDMQGNVAEWCIDVSENYPGSGATVFEDPARLRRSERDWLNVRGGAWWSVLHGYRQDGPLCADRSRSTAAANGYYGFRIVLAAEKAPGTGF
jgi:formylglycine-generating enzyme required for sulfatase activity